MIKVIAIVGARPQFIKHATIDLELSKHFELITIHTGQHYDENMSAVFFDQLGISKPKYKLEFGGGNHGFQTGNMLIAIEAILLDENPQCVLVYGDTNSTLAGALAASKLHIPVIHIEAGLRSFNREMPEEINRILTDHVSEILFISSEDARNNLQKEGISNNVILVGDVMIDLLNKMDQQGLIIKTISDSEYYYVTIHRPYNTDNVTRLMDILKTLNNLSLPVYFSLHPRTKNLLLNSHVDLNQYSNIRFLDPLNYLDNISAIKYARRLITDSGGMQKEAYFLKVPCITLRSETEWTETLSGNWNMLAFDDLSEIPKFVEINPEERYYNQSIYGSGDSSSKISKWLINHFN